VGADLDGDPLLIADLLDAKIAAMEARLKSLSQIEWGQFAVKDAGNHRCLSGSSLIHIDYNRPWNKNKPQDAGSSGIAVVDTGPLLREIPMTQDAK
jgi:hypothetical protein